MDFNPAGGTTAPLLYTWEELMDLESRCNKEPSGTSSTTTTAAPQMRIIRDDVAMRPDTAVYGVPYDFVDASEGSALSSLLKQAQQSVLPEILEMDQA